MHRTIIISFLSALGGVLFASMLGSNQAAVRAVDDHPTLWVSDDGTGLLVTSTGGVRVVEIAGFRPNLRKPNLNGPAPIEFRTSSGSLNLILPPPGTTLIDRDGVVVGTMTEEWLREPSGRCPLYGNLKITILGPIGDGLRIQYPGAKPLPLDLTGEGVDSLSLYKAIESHQNWYLIANK